MKFRKKYIFVIFWNCFLNFFKTFIEIFLLRWLKFGWRQLSYDIFNPPPDHAARRLVKTEGVHTGLLWEKNIFRYFHYNFHQLSLSGFTASFFRRQIFYFLPVAQRRGHGMLEIGKQLFGFFFYWQTVVWLLF